MSRRSILQYSAIAVLLLAAAFVIGRPDGDGPPLDPDSVGELGTRGLVEFLERSGSEVRRGLPGGDVDIVLVLQDRLAGGQRELVLDWIKDGGEAIITDPVSPLVATGLRGVQPGEDLDRGRCEIDELGDVDALSGRSLALLEPVPGAEICFGDDSGAYVLRFPDGEGVVTALGGALPFTNANLDQSDNAVLAGRLMLGTAPDRSARRTVSIIYSPIASTDETVTLGDLVGSNVRWFGWQLVVTAAVGVLWAVRRFGSVVHEQPIVELPGSLAVRATAELHRRSGTASTSLMRIRESLWARVRSEFRLPSDVGAEQVAAIVSARAGVPVDEFLAAVSDPASTDTDDALAHARRVDDIGRRILGDPTVTSAALPPERKAEDDRLTTSP